MNRDPEETDEALVDRLRARLNACPPSEGTDAGLSAVAALERRLATANRNVAGMVAALGLISEDRDDLRTKLFEMKKAQKKDEMADLTGTGTRTPYVHIHMPDEVRVKAIVDQVRPYHCLKEPDVELPALMRAFAETGARRFLEIGTYQGATAAAMHLAFPDAQIWTMDLPDPRTSRFNAQPKDKVGLAYRELGLTRRITQLWADAAQALTTPLLTPGFDLVFVDGDHSEDACFRDLCNSVRQLSVGGVIVAHDYTDESDAERPPWTRDVHRAVGRFMADGHAEAGWRRKRLPGWLVKLYCKREWSA